MNRSLIWLSFDVKIRFDLWQKQHAQCFVCCNERLISFFLVFLLSLSLVSYFVFLLPLSLSISSTFLLSPILFLFVSRSIDWIHRSVIACNTRASGKHPQKQPENDKLNGTWHVYNFSFYVAQRTKSDEQPIQTTRQPSSVWNVISPCLSLFFHAPNIRSKFIWDVCFFSSSPVSVQSRLQIVSHFRRVFFFSLSMLLNTHTESLSYISTCFSPLALAFVFVHVFLYWIIVIKRKKRKKKTQVEKKVKPSN